MEISLVSTSLPVLDLVKQTPALNRKIMWILLLFLATLLSIYQTIMVAHSFFQLSVSTTEVEEYYSENNMALTLCVNRQTKYSLSDPQLKETLIKLQDLDPDCNPISPSLFCLSLFSERERLQLGHELSTFECLNFQDPPCFQQYFNNLYYGNCVTTEDTSPDIAYLGVILKYRNFLKKKLLPVVVIHEKGTPPVFNPETTFVPGHVAYVHIQTLVKKTVFEGDFWESSGECLKSEQQNVQSWSIFDIFKTNNKTFIYKYSFESCLDQCIHNLTKMFCRCILPKSMFGVNHEKLPICNQMCNKIPRDQLDSMCNCKKSCVNFKIKTEKLDISSTFEDSKLSGRIECQDAENRDNLTVLNFLQERKTSAIETIKVVFAIDTSLTIGVVYIVLIGKLEDALSTVGGIWGIWLGLSVSVMATMGIESIFKFLSLKNIVALQGSRTVRHVLWWTTVTVILIIFIWQIVISVDNFYQYKVVNVRTTKPQLLTSFPLVYVCYNSEFYYNADKISGNKALKKKVDHLLKLNRIEKSWFWESEFTQNEKLLLLPTTKDFIQVCQYQTDTGRSVSCSFTDKVIKNNSSFWPCAIIMPEGSITSGDEAKIQDFTLEFKFPQNNIIGWGITAQLFFQPLSMLEDSEVQMSENGIVVWPGDLVQAEYSLTEVRRLKSPYTAKCIPENSSYLVYPPQLKESMANLSYSYTFKDCIQLCYFNYWQICYRQLEQNCHLKATDISDCQCQQPCKASNFQFKITQTGKVFTKPIDRGDYNSVSDLCDYVWSVKAVVHIKRQFSTMNVVTETPLIQEESFVGIIGGLLGLWIGQSMLNILVHLHYFLTMVKKRPDVATIQIK